MKRRCRPVAAGIAATLLSASTAWGIAWVPLQPESGPLPFEIDFKRADARRGDVSAQMQMGEWYSGDSGSERPAKGGLLVFEGR